MTDKINTGRRWVANFATTPKPPCVGDIPHGPVDTRQGAWLPDRVHLHRVRAGRLHRLQRLTARPATLPIALY